MCVHFTIACTTSLGWFTEKSVRDKSAPTKVRTSKAHKSKARRQKRAVKNARCSNMMY